MTVETKRLRELLAECDELDCDNWDCETARQMKQHLPALLDEVERLRAENLKIRSDAILGTTKLVKVESVPLPFDPDDYPNE